MNDDAVKEFNDFIASLPEPQPLTELERLRIRCANQRRELRRLNRQLEAFWRGVGFAHQHAFRVKMVKAFGAEAVNAAEDATEIGRTES